MQNVETNTKTASNSGAKVDDKILANSLTVLLDVESALATLGDPQDESVDWHASTVTMSAAFVGCMATMLLAYAVKYEGYTPHSKSDLRLLQMADSQEEQYLN